MCYAKPGPRCSEYATQQLTQATIAYEENPTPETEQKLTQAREDYELTPAGIRELREQGIAAIQAGELVEGVELYRQADDNSERRQELINKVTEAAKIVQAKSKDLVEYIKAKIDEALSHFPYASDDTLARLAESDDEEVRARVAVHPHTSPETLSYLLSTDRDERVRMWAAANPHTPVDALSAAAKDKSDAVRVMVANNKNTFAGTLTELTQDESKFVRLRVAANPASPAKALEILADDAEYEVRDVLAENRNTPPRVLTELFAHSRNHKALAENPSTPATLLHKMGSGKDKKLRAVVAANPSIPAKPLGILSEDRDRAVRLAVLSNPSASVSLIRKVAKKDRSRAVRNRALSLLD